MEKKAESQKPALQSSRHLPVRQRGEDIEELFLDIALFSKGLSVLNFSYPVCEVDLPKFSFCGRRKGEQIYYAGSVNNPGFEIPKGEYQVLLELYNQDHSTVACANATVLCP
ncbi:lymphocyte antigen 86 isoform X2 [Hippopotamus amphibius kiboko]|uniref:lymphocyte antigen 86 isoform X2 n=1 Tax=Hippopotamus amphibius kiboko TaxID=575201 RepID=UPI002595A5C5|nr:lymphocyte antigen 86 isoform X2 [Hippopotamus amphibius kiboko]